MKKKTIIFLSISIAIFLTLFLSAIYFTYQYQQEKIEELEYELEMKIDKYESEINNLLIQKELHERQILDIKNRILKLDDELKNKEDLLNLEIEKINEKENEIKNLTEEIDKLKSQIESLETRLRRYVNVSISPSGEKRVYLTFDDGPSALTPKVLDVLQDYNVKATFFVVGASANSLPRVIQRTYNEGHMVLPHTYTHNYSIYTTFDTYYTDLRKVENAIESILGIELPKLLRFPGGSTNQSSYQYGGRDFMHNLTKDVVSKGYYYVDWNVSSGDAGGNKSKGQIIANTIKWTNNKKVAVSLFHDTSSNSGLIDALPEILEYYIINEYEFVTFKNISQKELDILENLRVVNMPIN